MSNRVAIATDSSSGITPQQGAQWGISVLPMPFLINEKPYWDGVNLTPDGFYQMLAEEATVSTSQPEPSRVTDLWDELLKTHDEVVYIPLSSGLSASCATAKLFAEDYAGRVQVVDAQRVSVILRQAVLDARVLADHGHSAAEIADILTKRALDASIYIMVDTMTYLKRGGRVTPAAAAIATVLRIRPILQIHGDKLDAFAKARSVAQARELMIRQVRRDAEERFGGLSACRFAVAHTHNPLEAQSLAAQVQEAFHPDEPVVIDELSLTVACHIGPGSLAVTVEKKGTLD